MIGGGLVIGSNFRIFGFQGLLFEMGEFSCWLWLSSGKGFGRGTRCRGGVFERTLVPWDLAVLFVFW